MDTKVAGYVPEEMESHLAHFILLVVFSGFATTSVVLRFWARKMLKQEIALHDYLIVLGLVSILKICRVKLHSLMIVDDRSLHLLRLVSLSMVDF